MKNTFLAFLVFGAVEIALGQTDSVFVLEEVKITGLDLSRYASGTVLRQPTKGNDGALSQLSQFTSIHFKNYGNQQLSSISFRGTHPSHTNVVWNGLQVNSPTLGQTDFSLWPMFLVDDITIQHGGGSSLLGSGAIGGSILLDNAAFERDSSHLLLYGAHGSFGQYDGGIKASYELGAHTKGQSRIYYGEVENDFPLEQGGRQVHAGVKRFGASQKIGFSFKSGNIFTEIAYATNDRENQPTITSADRSTLLSRNLRAVINNSWDVNNATHDLTLGVIQDQTIFNDSLVTKSYRLTRSYSFNKNLSSTISFRIGGMILNEWAISENYGEKEKQNQLQLFSSLTFYPTTNLEVTSSVREVISGKREVFVPSLGLEYSLFSTSFASIRIRGQASRNFRTPTFNDLFWQPGGNPELKPETSKNAEMGVDWAGRSHKIGITAFHSDIRDWIQWRPVLEGIWSPENVSRVQTKGLEVFGQAQAQLGLIGINVETSYTHVMAENQDIGSKNQLIYVPKHELSANVSVAYKQSYMSWRCNYTSLRYTTLSNSEQSAIDGFLLLDVELGRSIRLKNQSINIKLATKNILDLDYQVVKNRAMPGRSFLIELTTKI